MKYKDVATVHRQPEAPVPAKSSTDPLHLRLYFKAHLTDLVRAIGYEHVALDEVRNRLTKLSERYGRALIDEAAQELLDIQSNSNVQVAYLKENVRKIAFALLGRPPAHLAPATVPKETKECENADESLEGDIDGEMDLRDDEPDDEDDDAPSEAAGPETGDTLSSSVDCSEAIPIRLVPHDVAEAKGEPLDLPQSEIKVSFDAWIAATGQSADVLSPEQLRKLSTRKRIIPNYLLITEESPTLVVLRPKLSKKQRTDLSEWQKVFGANHAVIRVWPLESPNGCVWTFETIVHATNSPHDDSAKVRPVSATTDAVATSERVRVSGHAIDVSHVAHRIDLLQEELNDLDELLMQADKNQRQLRTDLEAVRDQLRRAMPNA